MKRNLLLQRDYVLFDPMDALNMPLQATIQQGDRVITFRRTAAFGVTLSVYGTIGTSDLTGEKTVENMEIWLGDGEITNGLEEKFILELIHACVEENP